MKYSEQPDFSEARLNRDHPMGRNLLGWWLVDVDSSPLYRDMSPYQLHGDIADKFPFDSRAPTPFGIGVDFLGPSSRSDRFFDFGPAPHLQDLSRGFSVMARFKRSDLNGPWGSAGFIASVGTGGWSMRCESSGVLGLIQSQIANILTCDTPTTINEWYHGCFTISSEATATVIGYLDGVPDGSTTTTVDFTSPNDFHIGADLGEDENWVGCIDDVRIYNRILSQSEIRNIVFDPWDVFEPRKETRHFIFGIPGVTIDPDALSQAQALAEPTIDYLAFISAEALSQAQALTEPDVTEGVSIAPNAVDQAQSLTEPPIDVRYFLAPELVTQAQALDEPAIDYLLFVAADDVLQNQSLTEPTIGEKAFLVPAALVQGQTLDQAIVVPEGAVVPLGVSQTQSLGEPAIGYELDLDPDGVTQNQALDAADVVPVWQILADDVSQPQSLDDAEIITGIVILTDPVTQQQTVDEVSLLVRRDIAPDFLTQAQRLDAVTVFVPGLEVSPRREWRIQRETRGWKIRKETREYKP